MSKPASKTSAFTIPMYGVRKAAMVRKAAVADSNSTIVLLELALATAWNCHTERKSSGSGEQLD